MRRPAAAAISLLLAVVLGACGGGAPSRVSAIPEELAGVWETKTPDGVWTLKFLGTGGDGNGPSVFLSSDRGGELAGPISLSGRRITLSSEPTCNEYRFEVTTRGGRPRLHLQPDEDLGGCPDTRIGCVLAPREWARPGALATTPATAAGRPASRRTFTPSRDQVIVPAPTGDRRVAAAALCRQPITSRR